MTSGPRPALAAGWPRPGLRARAAVRVSALAAASVAASTLTFGAVRAQAQPAEPAAAPVPASATCDERAPLPAKFRLAFDAQARRGPFSLDGENELLFALADGQYTLRSRTRSLLFSADQSSRGALDGGTLMPVEYVENAPRRPRRSTQLDWATGTVTFSANGETAPTQPRLQDRLSMLLQLSLRARAQPAAAIEIPVAGVRHTSVYRFEPRGPETLELAAGRIDTAKFERPLTADQDRIEVWLAPSLCWLPARLRFTDDKGQVIDNQLRRARID